MIEIDMKANVCCVKYHPDKGHEIAVGSADHQVHLFDLRNASRPVFVFPGKLPANPLCIFGQFQAILRPLKYRTIPVLMMHQLGYPYVQTWCPPRGIVPPQPSGPAIQSAMSGFHPWGFCVLIF